VFNNNQVLEFKAKLRDGVVGFQSVFRAHGSLSAPDPDELVVIQVELGAAPDDSKVVVISVQNPVILLREKRDWLDLQFCGLVLSVVSSIDDIAFNFAAVFPCRVEHDIVVSHVDRGNDRLSARVLRSFIWVVVSLDFEPCSEIFGEIKALHDRWRRAAFECQGSREAQGQHQTLPRHGHLLVCFSSNVLLASKERF